MARQVMGSGKYPADTAPTRNTKPAGKTIDTEGFGPIRRRSHDELRHASLICATYALKQPDPVACLRELRGLLGLDGAPVRNRFRTVT